MAIFSKATMQQTLKSYLTPPAEDDGVKHLYVQIFFYAFLGSAFLSGGTSVYYIYQQEWLVVASSLSTALASLTSLYLIQSGRTTTGIALTIAIGYFAIMIGMTSQWGETNLGLLTIYPHTILAALVLQEYGLWIFGITTIIWVASLYLAEIIGFYDHMVHELPEPFYEGFLVISLFLLVVLVVRFIIENTIVINENLSVARAKAEKADQLKSLFLANMSHELRTPLNAIIGYSEGIIEEGEYDNSIDPETLAEVNQILSSGRGLLELINNILDISKIEAERMNLRSDPIRVRALVEEMLGAIRSTAYENENTIKLTYSSFQDVIVGDRRMISKALFNLANYSAVNTSGGQIEVEVSDNNSQHILIRIEDSGPGIPPEEVPYVLDLFHRRDSSSVRQTEYGLVMASKLIDLIGGRVEFHSEVGVGTTFWVTLPSASSDPV